MKLLILVGFLFSCTPAAEDKVVTAECMCLSYDRMDAIAIICSKESEMEAVSGDLCESAFTLFGAGETAVCHCEDLELPCEEGVFINRCNGISTPGEPQHQTCP